MNQRYEAFTAAAAKISSRANRTEVSNIIDSAWDNAYSTLKEQPDTEMTWDQLFTATIGSLLSCNPYNRHVVAFFTSRGITY